MNPWRLKKHSVQSQWLAICVALGVIFSSAVWVGLRLHKKRQSDAAVAAPPNNQIDFNEIKKLLKGESTPHEPDDCISFHSNICEIHNTLMFEDVVPVSGLIQEHPMVSYYREKYPHARRIIRQACGPLSTSARVYVCPMCAALAPDNLPNALEKATVLSLTPE